MTTTRTCDRLIQRYACLADFWGYAEPGHCARCGRRSTCGHHAIGRRAIAYRYRPENIVPLCFDCHGWTEQNPLAADQWLTEQRPRHAVWVSVHKHIVHPNHQTDYPAEARSLRALIAAATKVTP